MGTTPRPLSAELLKRAEVLRAHETTPRRWDHCNSPYLDYLGYDPETGDDYYYRADEDGDWYAEKIPFASASLMHFEYTGLRFPDSLLEGLADAPRKRLWGNIWIAVRDDVPSGLYFHGQTRFVRILPRFRLHQREL